MKDESLGFHRHTQDFSFILPPSSFIIAFFGAA